MSTTNNNNNPVYDVLVSFDTTGSMYRCLAEVRIHLAAMIQRLMTEMPGIRIGVIAHGDYQDAEVSGSYLLKKIDFTTNQTELVTFVEQVQATNGFDYAEAYEYVLKEAQAFSWRMSSIKAFIMIGDAYPHDPQDSKFGLDWRKETDQLHGLGIPIYSVQALDSGKAACRMFWQTIAQKTNGYHLLLDQFHYIRDILMAVCFKQVGSDRLGEYEQEVIQREHGMTLSMKRLFDTMLGRSSSPSSSTSSINNNNNAIGSGSGSGGSGSSIVTLSPVPPSKYQMLPVSNETSIKQFVVSQPGLDFKPGKGFYEFTKPEIIQANKEVVLMHKATGQLYEGTNARTIAGIGSDAATKRYSPSNTTTSDYRVFIQSTSHTRKLKGNTLFLYQAADWRDE